MAGGDLEKHTGRMARDMARQELLAAMAKKKVSLSRAVSVLNRGLTAKTHNQKFDTKAGVWTEAEPLDDLKTQLATAKLVLEIYSALPDKQVRQDVDLSMESLGGVLDRLDARGKRHDGS